ncbi:MAG TPA: hypothetical protein VHO67_17665 [Polyangia bacterium]|nr:hypothetical protein [Polyangia bacterium]
MLALVVGCHRGGAGAGTEAAPAPEAVQQAFARVKKQFGDLQQRFADLGRDVEGLPADLPGYPQLRAAFYAGEEARGVTDARLTLLSDRLDAAVASGRAANLRQLGKEIEQAQGQAREIDRLYLQLLHQVLAFQRAAQQSGSRPLVAK